MVATLVAMLALVLTGTPVAQADGGWVLWGRTCDLRSALWGLELAVPAIPSSDPRVCILHADGRPPWVRRVLDIEMSPDYDRMAQPRADQGAARARDDPGRHHAW